MNLIIGENKITLRELAGQEVVGHLNNNNIQL